MFTDAIEYRTLRSNTRRRSLYIIKNPLLAFQQIKPQGEVFSNISILFEMFSNYTKKLRKLLLKNIATLTFKFHQLTLQCNIKSFQH